MSCAAWTPIRAHGHFDVLLLRHCWSLSFVMLIQPRFTVTSEMQPPPTLRQFQIMLIYCRLYVTSLLVSPLPSTESDVNEEVSLYIVHTPLSSVLRVKLTRRSFLSCVRVECNVDIIQNICSFVLRRIYAT